MSHQPASQVEDLPLHLSVGSLVLEPPSEVHRATVVDLLGGSDEVAKWTNIPFPYGNTDFDDYLEMDPPSYVILEGGQFLGSVGGTVDKESLTASVGYWLAPNARGRGVATMACRAVCEELLRVGYLRLEAEVMVGNPTSGGLLQRCGFSREGVRRSVHASACGVGLNRVDMEVWSLLPGELR